MSTECSLPYSLDEYSAPDNDESLKGQSLKHNYKLFKFSLTPNLVSLTPTF